ncbi:MAG: Protein GrpE [Parcubacteria group bacterium GW2011_GWA2_38_13]|nr:MAG: Protein GrpE [Parcubacteria group bacterium GW2011_GWA2_38_13]
MENIPKQDDHKKECSCDGGHCAELDKKIEEMEKKMEEYLNGWKRAKADYLNLKKENDANQKEVMGYAFAATIMQFLPVYDNLETAFKHVPKDLENIEWVRGVENIKKQCESILKEMGVERIHAIGEKFNPEFHEAMADEKKEGVGIGVIFEEMKSGYTMHGKTIIPAKVKVGK